MKFASHLEAFDNLNFRNELSIYFNELEGPYKARNERCIQAIIHTLFGLVPDLRRLDIEVRYSIYYLDGDGNDIERYKAVDNSFVISITTTGSEQKGVLVKFSDNVIETIICTKICLI